MQPSIIDTLLCQWGGGRTITLSPRCGTFHVRLLTTDSLLGSDPFGALGDMPDFDLSPLSTADFLNGEGFSLPLDGFINLSPPHSHDYHFGLEDHEGISELFDCDFGDLSQVLGDS